ncbi:unnamed protein product [Oppiella nova]|uniref:Uncharacterized protein n=1 Tax=Oppiella nova TaxID=334625 RepID=A0A7R9QKU7_9ACAR|nr:unnamed protein product [Oppiella nova]CAG2167008.1 unnamed protein product [Oppiella nova]
MVTRPEIYADTIEDLLDDRYEVYTDDFKYDEWRGPKFLSPQKLRTFFSNKVLILDQMSMDVIEPYYPRFMAIHVGQQYLSVLITPLCVGPTFEFINQSNVIAQHGYNDIYLNDTQSLFVFMIYNLNETMTKVGPFGAPTFT